MPGVPIKSSSNPNQSRVNLLDFSHWGCAVRRDVDFYDVDAQTVVPIDSVSGGLASSYLFYFVAGVQVWNESSPSGSYMSNLATATDS